jgi:D-psicose/D-tagatose/L-ribulose 3-epimerase
MTNSLGVHALVWVGGWSPEECDRAIASTVQAGFDMIEIPALDPAKIDVEYTRASLERHGLQAGVSLGLTRENDINSEDPACVARGLDVLMSALDVAHGIGAKFMGGVLFSALAKYPGPASPLCWSNSAGAIKELAQEAALKDVTLGIEFVNRYESNLLNTVEQTLRFLDDVDEPNAVVHADVYHMNIEEEGFRNPLLLAGDRLGYVHIGESNRGYLGTGTIDFDEVFGALVDANYTGPMTFESFSSAVVDPQLSNTLAVWRNLWTDGMDLATKAHAFITEGMQRQRDARGR